MKRLPLRFGCTVSVCLAFGGFAPVPGVRAELVVDAAQPVTHRVEIQPVRVRKNPDGLPAAGMGTAEEEAYIKEQAQRVWAQAGVRLDWLPFTEYTDAFAFDGTPGDYRESPRPSGHLETVVNAAGSPPKAASRIVLNLFFVQIVPGFQDHGESVASGFAFIDGNGVMIHAGRDLLGSAAGRDMVAGVIAHEIGHNLGLRHVAGLDNLMGPGDRTAARLTAQQRATIFTDDAGINDVDGFDLLQPVTSTTNYALWAAAGGVTGRPEEDGDRDGLPNVVEFMLGLDPRGKSELPEPEVTGGGLIWRLTKRAGAVEDGLVYHVQTSRGNMEAWCTAGSPGSGSVILQDDDEALVVRLESGEERAFMRLAITVPPGQ